MQALILLAVVGLSHAGGIPVSSDYSISTHGPDRSFTLVHKSQPALLANKMMLADPLSARGFMDHDLAWAGKTMGLAGKTLIGDARFAAASPLIYNDWAPKALGLADSRLALAAKGLTSCIDCVAPTVSTVVTRTVHKPELAIEKSLIAPMAIAQRSFIGDKLADKWMADKLIADKMIAGRSIMGPMAFSDKLFADKLVADKLVAEKLMADRFVADKLLADKMLADKWIADKVIAERAFASPILANKVMVDPLSMADKMIMEKSLFAPKLMSPMTLAGKDLLTDKLISDKFIADKLFADKIAATSALATPLAMTGKMMTSPLLLGDKGWMDDKLMLAGKDLIGRPMGFANDAWLADKALVSPFGAKTMFIKK